MTFVLRKGPSGPPADVEVDYPPPGGGLLRVPVGGGVPEEMRGSIAGQLTYWKHSSGLWLPTDTGPSDGQSPVWNAAGEEWEYDTLGGLSNLQYFDTTHAPVGLWNFDNTLADTSGNGNNLVLAAGNPGFSDVVPGKKGLFVWVGSRYATPAAVPLLQLTGDYTMEVILQQDGNPITNNAVIATYRGITSGLEADNILYQFRVDATGAFTTTRNVASVTQSGAAVAATYTSAGTSDSLGCIHNIVFLAIRRQSNVMQFFLNGLPFGNPSGVLATPTGGNGVNTRFVVGANGPSAVAVEVAVLIFGLKLINRALTDEEVKAEYNRTMGPAFGALP